MMIAYRDANLPEPAWRTFRDHFGLKGQRRDDDARRLASRLFRVALAVLHAPAYQSDHRSALSADWAHLPVSKATALFERLVESDDLVSRLLDSHIDARDQVFGVIGEERAAHLAQLRKTDGSAIRPEDLRITQNYWGGSKGRWVPRAFTGEEDPLPAWGERTGDLYIADGVFFANVPEAVWKYELGGYPVLKKWLGYRQADRRDGRPLTPDERRWFKSIVQRIAALIALSAKLDELYSAASENALTAAELGIER